MASASLGGAASTTTVTLSLPSLIEQLKDIVSEDRKEPLDALLRQAKESTHEQVHIKKQMIALATPDELRAAVNAIMAAAEASASSQQSETPAAAAAPPAPAEQAGSSNSLSQQMPDPTSELEQLETMFDDTTKEHFRHHPVRCRTAKPCLRSSSACTSTSHPVPHQAVFSAGCGLISSTTATPLNPAR
eukprot:6172651-Pleurochrysis_carterae.AAC.5